MQMLDASRSYQNYHNIAVNSQLAAFFDATVSFGLINMPNRALRAPHRSFAAPYLPPPQKKNFPQARTQAARDICRSIGLSYIASY